MLQFKFVLFLNCLFCFSWTFSQQLEEAKSREFQKKSLEVYRGDILKAKKYALLGYHFAKASKNDTLIMESARKVGIFYKMLEDIDSSQFYSEVGAQYAMKLGQIQTAAVLNTVIAVSYVNVGNYSDAYTYFEKAEKLYTDLNKEEIDSTYFFFKLNKSSLFNELTLYDLMLTELFQAESIADSIGDYNFMGQILSSIAVAYKMNGDLKTSISYSKKSLKYFRKGEMDLAIVFTNLANSFSALKEVDSALQHYNNAQKIYLDCNAASMSLNKLSIAKAQMFFDNNLAQKAEKILLTIKDEKMRAKEKAKVNLLFSQLSSVLEQKIFYANESLEYATAASDITMQKESSYILYQQYKESKDFTNALSFYEKYQVLEDSIFNREKSKAIQKVLVQKIIHEKNSEIDRNTLKFEKEKALKDRMILFVLLILLLILFVLGLVFFRFKSQKQKTKIEVQEKKLLEKENEGIKNELIHVLFESDRNFELIKSLKDKLKEIKLAENKEAQLNSLFVVINDFVVTESQKRNYKDQFGEIREVFFQKISKKAKLTKTEKKMAVLLKLDLSSKQIAAALNVTDPTVEVYRSRLRKKLELDKDYSLSAYFNSL